MKVKRYQAVTSREALARVKKELGADAVILSNRPSQGGVEILALASEDVGAVTSAPQRKTPPAQPQPQPLKEFALQKQVPVQENAALFQEMKSMRALVEQQLATLSWTEEARRNPGRAQVTRELLAAGFSAPLARKIASAAPAALDPIRTRDWLKGVLAKNLGCTPEHEGPVERGGVFALVGPTGVGKTTTVAKVAARCVVRFGSRSVGLISTDAYRVGAQDQLRIYARILGVAVHNVQEEAGLAQALQDFAGRRLVLIDTVGMGQRDARLAEQLQLLADRRVQRIVMLNAASQIETLEDVAKAYKSANGSMAIVTKLDEARRFGGALDVAMRHRLALPYVTDGQRVPEDIRIPAAATLAAQALEGAAESPFALQDGELFGLKAA